MHIITQKRIWEAIELHPESARALDGWYRVMKRNRFAKFSDLRNVFSSVDKVGDLYVFDIGGNKLRLIANIHFLCQRVYIRKIMTHQEYDANKWRRTR